MTHKFPCYIHIEKCAGTTLHHTLKYNLPGYVILRPWYYWSNEEGNNLSAKELKMIKTLSPSLSGIGGHTARTYLEYEKIIKKPISYFTILREPISRYMSHYNHQVNKMGKKWTLEEFIKEERFDNFMTSRIAGKEDLALAKKRLKEDYDFVGLFEAFNESLVMLKYFSFDDQIDLNYEHKNNSKKETKLKFADLSTELKAKVKKKNKLDIALYQYVIDEIYPQQKTAYPHSLGQEIKKFEEVNKTYKYNFIRHNYLRGSKLLSDKVIQSIAHKRFKTR